MRTETKDFLGRQREKFHRKHFRELSLDSPTRQPRPRQFSQASRESALIVYIQSVRWKASAPGSAGKLESALTHGGPSWNFPLNQEIFFCREENILCM
jgi:hypothetical protein